MSVRRFARDVPRSVRHAVLVALDLADEKGEVVGGMRALQEALGHDSERSTRAAVAAAEEHRLLRRSGGTGHTRRLFLGRALDAARRIPSAPVTDDLRGDTLTT